MCVFLCVNIVTTIKPFFCSDNIPWCSSVIDEVQTALLEPRPPDQYGANYAACGTGYYDCLKKRDSVTEELQDDPNCDFDIPVNFDSCSTSSYYQEANCLQGFFFFFFLNAKLW